MKGSQARVALSQKKRRKKARQGPGSGSVAHEGGGVAADASDAAARSSAGRTRTAGVRRRDARRRRIEAWGRRDGRREERRSWAGRGSRVAGRQPGAAARCGNRSGWAAEFTFCVVFDASPGILDDARPQRRPRGGCCHDRAPSVSGGLLRGGRARPPPASGLLADWTMPFAAGG
jgi:hypothetical protein